MNNKTLMHGVHVVLEFNRIQQTMIIKKKKSYSVKIK